MYKCLIIAPYLKFKQHVDEVSKSFPFSIHTEIGNIPDGPALAKMATEEGYDVIVSRGGTSRTIQKHCAIPVVEIKITNQDILDTLNFLKEHGKVGIIGSSNVVYGVRMMADLLGIEIMEFITKSEHEIEQAVVQAKSLGVDTIIGDALTVQKAIKSDIKTVLIPSGKEAIFEALKEVEKMIYFHDRITKQNGPEETTSNLNFDQFIARSTQMRKIISSARKVSGTSSPILIYGEPGTGKQSLAQAIHNASRLDGNFVVLNCERDLSTQYLDLLFQGTTNNQQSLFELAHLGTIYLKNINCLPRNSQILLLNLIKKSTLFNVRIIASSMDPLDVYVERGDFSKSFFDYLNIYKFHLPPLRERNEDIEALAHWFLTLACLKLGKHILEIDEAVFTVLKEFRWPENISQLKTLIEQMCFITNGPIINQDEVEHLLRLSSQSNGMDDSQLILSTLNKTLEQIEMEIIYHVLKEEDYNQTWTAKRLGIDRSTLWRKLKAFQKNKSF